MTETPTPKPQAGPSKATVTATHVLSRWTRSTRDFTRAHPRTMSVGGAVAVALVVGMGRFAFTGSAAPAAATASLSRPMTVLEPQATRMLARRPLSDQASPAVQEWVRTPIAPVGRNLFAIKLDYFPQDGTKVDQTLRAPQGNGFWDKLAKSMASRADQRRERQILVENLQLQAMQLRLQSTVMGPSPGALVNGSLVREGDVVASFRVLKIEARRIVVEREGIKLEIPMQ